MIRQLSISTMKRVYKSLPSGVRERAYAALTGRIYRSLTRGLRSDPVIGEWAQAHRRAVSIVIPSYNDFELLSACLASVKETCAAFELEIIVVDDYCQPANSARLRTLADSVVRVIFKERREGFAVAVNRGMVEAKYDIVVLNSDIIAKPGWLEALQYSAHAIDPLIGMVSPKLVYPDGRIQYGGTYWARVLAPQWFGHRFVGLGALQPEANVAGYNRSISGACVYVTRSAYERVGGLDEGYWLGFEDVDWGLTAWKAGLRCYYQPASLLVHHESATRGRVQGTRELASLRKFWSRWRDEFLTRTADARSVDFVISDAAPPLWPDYIRSLSERLGGVGVDCSVHEVAADVVDESLVEDLRHSTSIKVACDPGAATTTWIAAVEFGVGAYLLPTVETIAEAADKEAAARAIASYRPEFEYLTPNRWVGDVLKGYYSWEVRSRIAPVLPVEPLPDESSRTVVLVGLDPSKKALCRDIAETNDLDVIEFPQITSSVLTEIRARKPLSIVDLTEYPTSLVPTSLMSLGAVFVGRTTYKNKFEVLDGYDCLLVDPSDQDALHRAVSDAFSDPEVQASLRSNGHGSVDHLARTSIERFLAALEDMTTAAY